MTLGINQILPLDTVGHVLSFCNAQAARAAHTTCKIWMGVIDYKKLLYRAWCLDACPQATELNSSWKDRYVAMRHYSTDHCKQYTFDLGTFFERGFEWFDGNKAGIIICSFVQTSLGGSKRQCFYGQSVQYR